MRVAVKRHKHLKLDQQKIDFAKRYFGVTSEQEAIDRALGLLMNSGEFNGIAEHLPGLVVVAPSP